MKSTIPSLSNEALLAATHALADRSCAVEAELLAHMAEVDARKLWAARAFDSMFNFCVQELGFSEGAAYNRIAVARATLRFPELLQAIRSRRLHLSGARLLIPHLTEANVAGLLAEATGKTKRQVEDLVARLAPQPPVATVIRRVAAEPTVASLPLAMSPRVESGGSRATAPRPVVAPLSEATFKIQFTASRAFHDKLREAQDLLRHRFPNGDLDAVLTAALDALVTKTKKERFAVGRKPKAARQQARASKTRHAPDPMVRAVFERDGGRCTFVDDRGHRCTATSGLEIDHIEGFARTHEHSIDGMRLLCRAHNQFEAERLYGRAFMERARAARRKAARPGASPGSTVRQPPDAPHVPQAGDVLVRRAAARPGLLRGGAGRVRDPALLTRLYQSCIRRRIWSLRPSRMSRSFFRASSKLKYVKYPTSSSMNTIGMLSGTDTIAQKFSNGPMRPSGW